MPRRKPPDQYRPSGNSERQPSRGKADNPSKTNKHEHESQKQQQDKGNNTLSTPLIVAIEDDSLKKIIDANAQQAAYDHTKTTTALTQLASDFTDEIAKIHKELAKPPKGHSLNIWLLICNLILAAMTIIQGYFAIKQYEVSNAALKASQDSVVIARDALEEARKSAVETGRQNEQILNTSKDIAGANKSLAKSTERQSRASVQTANAADISASAAKQSTKVAQEAMILNARPYIGVTIDIVTLSGDQSIVLKVTLINEGNSIASVKGETNFMLADNKPNNLIDYTDARPFQEVEVLPHKMRTMRVTSPYRLTSVQWEGIQQRKLALAFMIRGQYAGAGGTYPFEAISCYMPEQDIKIFVDCLTTGRK